MLTSAKNNFFARLLLIIISVGLFLTATAGVFHLSEKQVYDKIDGLPEWIRTYVIPVFIGLVDVDFLQGRIFVISTCLILWVAVAGVISRIFSGEEKSYFHNSQMRELLWKKPEIAGFAFLIYMTISAALLSPSFFHGILSTVFFGCCLLSVLILKTVPITKESLHKFVMVISLIGGFLALGTILQKFGLGKYFPDRDESALPYWLSIGLIFSFVQTVRSHTKKARVISAVVNVLIAAGLVVWGMNHLSDKTAIGRFADFSLKNPLFGFGPGSVWSLDRLDSNYPVEAARMPLLFKGLMEFGFIGGGIFLLALVPALRLAYYNVRRNGYLTICWLSVIVLILLSCFANPLASPSLMMFVAVCLGFCLSDLTEHPVEVDKTVRNGKLSILGSFAIAGVLLGWLIFLLSYIVVNPFMSHVYSNDGKRWLALAKSSSVEDNEKGNRLNYARGVFRNAFVKDVFNGEANWGQAAAYKELGELSLKNLETIIDSNTTETERLGNAFLLVTQSHVDSTLRILTDFEKRFPFNKDMVSYLRGESYEILVRAEELTTGSKKIKEYRDNAAKSFKAVRDTAPEYKSAQEHLVYLNKIN